MRASSNAQRIHEVISKGFYHRKRTAVCSINVVEFMFIHQSILEFPAEMINLGRSTDKASQSLSNEKW